MGRNFHRLSAIFKLHNILQDYCTRILTLKCPSRIIKTSWTESSVNACKACAACTNLTGFS